MDELAEHFARAERRGLIQIVRTHAHLPMDKLLELVDDSRTGRLLGTLTVQECETGEIDESAIEQHDKAKLRAAYEGRILAALRDADEPLSPKEIRDRIGGSVRETRLALQRLAAAKKVTRTWKDRGHGYRLF